MPNFGIRFANLGLKSRVKKNHQKWDPQIGLLLYFLKDAKKGRQK